MVIVRRFNGLNGVVSWANKPTRAERKHIPGGWTTRVLGEKRVDVSLVLFDNLLLGPIVAYEGDTSTSLDEDLLTRLLKIESFKLDAFKGFSVLILS